MKPERWQQVKQTLAAALDQEDTRARSAFLQEACADDTALRREVDSLLAQPEDEFEECAQNIGILHPEVDAAFTAGRRVGAYELVSELGRGGMGAVWLATRADLEFQKEVAIKLLKRGTDTDEVLRRFRSEREILARLEHPNIARLLDAGTTPDGLPFFVMEYVVGARLTDYCFAQKLSVRDRLGLFLKVCGAVQFAHQNLVIHRDLKPANILVTAAGEPKLLDFGIAKLVADDTPLEVTAWDRQRLTPGYASPEQARGEAITTVSDVYSLGALLFELLTGAIPHRFSTRRPSAAELQQVITEQEPRKPSAEVSDRVLQRELSGDLDNIILTALRKEPARRYRGVGSFADDVGRYLANRPIRARGATTVYRARKFLRRNRRGVVAATLLVCAILGGVIATLRESAQTRRRADDVRRLADSFLFEFDDLLVNIAGSTHARSLIVGRALQYLDQVARDARGDRSLQIDLAQAFVKVGNLQGKPYVANLGDTAGALGSYGKAVAIAQPLAAAENGSRSTGARQVLSEAYANLGTVESRLNRTEDAVRHQHAALEINEKLLIDAPARGDEWRRRIVTSRLGLGDAIMARNHLRQEVEAYRAALVYYREALPICEQLVRATPASVPDRYRLIQTCSRIGPVLAEIGAATHDPAASREALVFHARSLALETEDLSRDPENVRLRRAYGGELASTAYARLLAGGELSEALGECDQAVAMQRALAAADPQNLEARQDLAQALYIRGRLAAARNERAVAADTYRECIGILEPLVGAHPDNVETAFDLGRARSGLAEVLQAAMP